MKLETICFIVIILFSLFGLLMFGNIIHESVHKIDLGDAIPHGTLCTFVMPNSWKDLFTKPIAFYGGEVVNQTKADEVSKYTEYRAYGIEGIIAILFLVCFIVVINKRAKEGYYQY